MLYVIHMPGDITDATKFEFCESFSQWSVTSGYHSSYSSSHGRKRQMKMSRQIVCDRTQTHLHFRPIRHDRLSPNLFRASSYSITVMSEGWLCLWQIHFARDNPGPFLAADSSTLLTTGSSRARGLNVSAEVLRLAFRLSHRFKNRNKSNFISLNIMEEVKARACVS
jgi:hypothetical protein